MAKKLSIAEILAAARAEKSGSAPAPASDAPAPTESSSPPPAEEVASAPPSPAAASAPKLAASKPAGQMSMAEILAAARAGKAGGAPAAPAAKETPKPAAPKPAPAPKAAAAKPSAEAKPAAAATVAKDTASILAAARKGAKPGPITKAEAAAKGQPVPEGKKKLEVPPMPAKPEYARPKVAAETATRRSFMAGIFGFAFGSSLAVGFSSLAITHLMWLLGLARFMFPNILTEPPTRFKVGFPDSFSPGQVETKFIPQFGVWIVRYDVEGQPMIYALKSVCTHLGCTPNWLEAEQKFKCPCHGSGFYKDGVNFEGPAPRPLERYAISLADDGQLLVDKSRTFNSELGQWKDTASFVPV